jgi:hypothetical protein
VPSIADLFQFSFLICSVFHPMCYQNPRILSRTFYICIKNINCIDISQIFSV